MTRNRKFAKINNQGNPFLRIAIRMRYTRHIIIFINIAQNPKRIISSFRKGTLFTTSAEPLTIVLLSNQLKKANSRNAILQMTVNLDKNSNTLIRDLV